jgi:hypothetical protein
MPAARYSELKRALTSSFGSVGFRQSTARLIEAGGSSTVEREPIRSPPMRTSMPSDRLVQLVLGDAPSRQAVIPMRAPTPPEEVSVRGRDSGVSPDSAVAAVELHNGEVCACRHGSREAERQYANCENKLFHSQTPHVAPSAASVRVNRRPQKAMSYQTNDAHQRCPYRSGARALVQLRRQNRMVFPVRMPWRRLSQHQLPCTTPRSSDRRNTHLRQVRSRP